LGLLNSRIQSWQRRELWKAWIPVALWLGIIVVESTASLSSENTARFLYPIFHFLFGLDPIQFLVWHHLLRKSGHVIGYAVLSLLFFRAWRITLPVAGGVRWSMVWARIAFFMAALVASLDEWHQTFLPSRTGTIQDVILDSCAALIAQILLFLILRRLETPGSGPDLPIASKPDESARTVSSQVAD
jgi:VanZ family protein